MSSGTRYKRPKRKRKICMSYFQDLQVCVPTQANTTAWQHLEMQLTNVWFHINDKPIPMILEKPIKSLGRWYNSDLKDTEQVEQLRQDTISGLKQFNTTALPGKLKLWCFQFGLLPRLM